jgi:hypothetical protein
MKSKLGELVIKYKNIGILKAGEILLHPDKAVQCLDELEQIGIRILGVDLWYYVGDRIVEDPGSLDLSEIEDAKASTSIARRFITSQLPDRATFVSFVFAEDADEYAVA